MSGFDQDPVYSVYSRDTIPASVPDTPSDTEKLFLEFLSQYRVGGEFIYRYAHVVQKPPEDT